LVSTWSGVGGNSITNDYCTAQKSLFKDQNVFAKHGGMEGMGAALAQGMVLVMSLWDDHSANMLWLDSNYPTTGASTTPGVARGTCDISSGVPSDVETNHPDASVVYSNIKVGPIGSTFNSGGSNPGTTTTAKPTTTTTTAGNPGGTGVAQHYGQCGGNGWQGPTTCASPYTCQKVNDWYSQCL
jgi:cellulose 1,4-beta-cellobiosidase